MSKSIAGTALTLCVVALMLVSGPVFAQEEGGGQSGADFLLNPSAPRSDSMGGVVDGQGDPLEGMFFNPAILMLDPNLYFNVGITPFPNGITDASLALGAPIGPGMFGVSGQLLSLGEFTYINSIGQPTGSVTVFDAAASAGYAMYVLDHLSVGASAKGAYRTLGDTTAFGVGVDLGAAWWFETPHVGQRPKPPTIEQLAAQRDKELAAVDAEKARRTREAAGDVMDLREEVEKLQANLEKIEAELAAAEEGDDTTKKEASRDETEASLRATTAQLADAEASSADALAEVEQWYEGAAAAVQTAHRIRVADLHEIQAERDRLFEVVDNPDTMLTAADIIKNIEDAISRTREFGRNRNSALRRENQAFRTSREARLAEIREQIAVYQGQIGEIAGPEAERLSRQIADLEDRIAELEASEDENAKDQRDAARAELSDARKQLDAVQSDPWVKRLQRRIEDKEAEAAELQAAIEAYAVSTDEAINALNDRTARDIADFETLSEELQTDLRRAQLRQELDLIDARTERSTTRALATYEATEQRIYQRLLAAMYGNEEKIFDSRISLANQDSMERRFETEAQLLTEQETLEDDFAFQERFLTQKINELNRSEPVNEAALQAAKDELSALEDDNRAKLAERNERLDSLNDLEDARLKQELDVIKAERQKVRLIYLQTDDPYLNTAITFAVRNLGTNLRFDTTGYPMPRSAALGVSYAAVNTDLHTFRISTEAEMPLYGAPTLADLQVGFGAEYSFADLVDIRAGYAIGSPGRSFSVGFGVDFALGFTNYAIDYSFRPIPDYGLLHSFAVAIGF